MYIILARYSQCHAFREYNIFYYIQSRLCLCGKIFIYDHTHTSVVQ